MENTPGFLTLKFDSEVDNIPEYRNPLYYESWIWEGDKSILPYKWIDLINDSKIQINELTNNNLEEYLKKNYYKNPEFDEKSFFFATQRSNTAACGYLDKNNIIRFLIVGKIHKNKQLEHSLISRAIKRCIEKAENKKDILIKVDLSTTNIDKIIYKIFGFK